MHYMRVMHSKSFLKCYLPVCGYKKCTELVIHFAPHTHTDTELHFSLCCVSLSHTHIVPACVMRSIAGRVYPPTGCMCVVHEPVSG